MKNRILCVGLFCSDPGVSASSNTCQTDVWEINLNGTLEPPSALRCVILLFCVPIHGYPPKCPHFSSAESYGVYAQRSFGVSSWGWLRSGGLPLGCSGLLCGPNVTWASSFCPSLGSPRTRVKLAVSMFGVSVYKIHICIYLHKYI